VLHLTPNVKASYRIILHKIKFLEWMITTSCDLACPGCDRFIDYNHAWTERYEDIETRMRALAGKLEPENLTLIGGEPLIHPRIYDIVKLVREVWPRTVIEVFSNGFLLEKRDKLLECLQECAPSKLSISIHSRQANFRLRIQENVNRYVFKNLDWEVIAPRTFRHGGVELDITDPVYDGWYDYRQVIDGKLKPWRDANPKASYEACGVPIFPIVYNGRIYKCPPISMLKTHCEKYGLMDDPDWQPYLQYSGYDILGDISPLVENIGCFHAICAMCPASPVLKPQQDAIIKTDRYEV